MQNKNNCMFNVSSQRRKPLIHYKDKEVIKEADKGYCVVIMAKYFYLQHVYQIIDDPSSYREINADEDNKLMKKFLKLSTRYKSELTENKAKFITHFEPETSNLYGLSKIQKSAIIKSAVIEKQSEYIEVANPSDLSMRPIIAGPICPTYRLSHLLDVILRPLVGEVTANIRDTPDLLQRLPEMMGQDCQLVTYDVQNLYGSIPHSLGLRAIEFWLDRVHQRESSFSKEFVIESLRWILKNNNFLFNGKHYRQLKGIAMGTKVAPVYATLTLGFLEMSLSDSILVKYGTTLCNLFKNNYFRFLDNILNILDVKQLPVSDLSVILF